MTVSVNQLVNSVEQIVFLVVLLELVLLVVGAVILRALLRINLTLKHELAVFITQLKQAKMVTKSINQQLSANQEVLATGVLSLGKALPKPFRWLTKVLRFII